MSVAVVTGAGGFIGRVLTEQLLSRGDLVYAVTRSRERLKDLPLCENLIVVETDFSGYINLEQWIPSADVFFHLAWAGGFEQSALRDYKLQLSNAKYACDAVSSAAKIGAKRFVYAATVNEIEIQQFIGGFETFQTRPTNIYAAAKLAGELICRTIAQAQQIHYNAGIIPLLYGKGNESKQLVNVVLTALIHNEAPKLIAGNNQYDLVSVKDVAKALMAIGDNGKNGMRYYIGHRQLKTFREWIEEMGNAVNPNVPLLFGEYKDPLDLDYSLIDLEALYRDTGYVCSEDFIEGILEHKEWLSDQLASRGK